MNKFNSLDSKKVVNILFAITIVFLVFIVFLGWRYYVAIHSEYLAGASESKTIKSVFLHQWDWIALIFAFISLVIGLFTAFSQFRTQQNTMRITPESQRQLLYDYGRHFYMNFIVYKAVRVKLNARYDQFYPSEEHIIKLKTDLGNLHPAIFFNNIKHYQAISKLQVKLRNFNEELDIILEHLKNKNLIPQVKERDFNTIDFKLSFLTKSVWNTLNVMWGANRKKINARKMREVIKTQLKGRNSEDIMKEAESYFENHPLYLTEFSSDMKESLFDRASPEEEKEMLLQLNYHIYAEIYGINKSGSEKIFLIPF